MGEVAALNQFMVWELFDLIPHEGAISYLDLAQHIHADVALVDETTDPKSHDRKTDNLARLGGMLVSTGRLVQPSSGHVAHSSTSHLFKSDSPPGNWLRFLFDHGLRGYTHWQDYSAENNNREPATVTHNPFTFSWGHPSKTVWDVVDMAEERS